jgi:DinB superfamily
MGQRAQALAEQFERVNARVTAFVERCSEADWRAPCRDEGRPVAVVAYHIAAGHRYTVAIARAGATGQAPPPWVGMTREAGNHINARQAAEHDDCTTEEVLVLLRRNGAVAAEFLRGLSDEQLDRGVPFAGDASTEQLASVALTGHAEGHLRSLEATIPVAR